jgi:hypothetical protein
MSKDDSWRLEDNLNSLKVLINLCPINCSSSLLNILGSTAWTVRSLEAGSDSHVSLLGTGEGGACSSVGPTASDWSALAKDSPSRGGFETTSEDGSALSYNNHSPTTSSSGQRGVGIGRHASTSMGSQRSQEAACSGAHDSRIQLAWMSSGPTCDPTHR